MKRVLIVDNDSDMLEVMQEALTYQGFEVVTASDTDDIVSLVSHHQPNLLLIDYILDGINGGELCHQVKSNTSIAGTPVIIMTAYPKVLQSLGYYGCNALISKPFDLNQLTSTVSNLINNPNQFLN